jgi:hypothetical protein
MDEHESLSLTKWESKYRVVSIPRGQVRQHLGILTAVRLPQPSVPLGSWSRVAGH